jgi:iron-sulfur cluster assembly accessory protein
MTTTTEAPATGVTLTDEAVRQAKRWIEREKKPGAFLRMGLMGGGCSGFSYVLKVDTERTPVDTVYDFDGLEVVVDRRSLRLLAGTVLEYTGNLMMPGGFEFHNPNAKKGCGCGLSFSV